MGMQITVVMDLPELGLLVGAATALGAIVRVRQLRAPLPREDRGGSGRSGPAPTKVLDPGPGGRRRRSLNGRIRPLP
jgi:hypothetical protein